METKGLAIKFVKRICRAGGLNKYAPLLFSKFFETGYFSKKKIVGNRKRKPYVTHSAVQLINLRRCTNRIRKLFMWEQYALHFN